MNLGALLIIFPRKALRFCRKYFIIRYILVMYENVFLKCEADNEKQISVRP